MSTKEAKIQSHYYSNGQKGLQTLIFRVQHNGKCDKMKYQDLLIQCPALIPQLIKYIDYFQVADDWSS